MTYTAPTRDLFFAAELAGLDSVNRLPGFEEATPDVVRAILYEAGKFGGEVLAPLNRGGDLQGARLHDGAVHTADGWRDAYRQFCQAGWNGLAFDARFGGQGLPWLVASAVNEIWHAANMSFALCPLLTQSAIEAIDLHGSEEQKQTYLPNLISGQWCGTMNLTEAQAGSDLSAVRTRAVADNGRYLLSGQKIFITYGDHDLADNIIHLVLARTADAPPGVKGISLFIAPKFLPDDNGEWTQRNDIETVSLEHKLGIRASPTATLAYGAKRGAVGHLVGELNHGMRYMFTMMNVARHAVGLEGNGVAERAYQQAASFAAQRVQGRGVDDADGERLCIIEHPDVKRMLWMQKCRIEAFRSLLLDVAARMDHLRAQPDDAAKTRAREMMEIMTPIVKGCATEVAGENVSLALQVHGGMGFVEETGAAQHYRDQRITPIYEGTTGIQAMDLIGRKLIRDGGAMHARVLGQLRAECESLNGGDEVALMNRALCAALDLLDAAAQSLLATAKRDVRAAYAVGEPYLRLWGTAACGWQMLKAAELSARRLKQNVAQDEGEAQFYRNKLQTARFYFAAELPKVDSLAKIIANSASLVAESDAQLFAAE